MSDNKKSNMYDAATSKMLAERILFFRTEVLDISQKEFAAILNISQSCLSMIENNQRLVNRSLIHAINMAFNVKIEDDIYDMSQSESSNSSIAVLSKEYSLSYSEEAFIEYFLRLAPTDRAELLNCLRTLSRFTFPF